MPILYRGQRPRKRVQDNPVKWASLPEWMQDDIEEREQRRDQGGGLRRNAPLRVGLKPGVGRCTRLRRQVEKRKQYAEKTTKTRLVAATFKDKVRLKKAGRRGKRLAAADKRISELFRAMDCICGCSAEPDPAHLTTRRNEDTRHVEHLIIPLCRLGHRWLDQTAEGVQCRALLFEMAQAKGEVLTHAEFWPVADAYGMYGWMAQQRARR